MNNRARPDDISELIRRAGDRPEPSKAFRRQLHEQLATAWQADLQVRRQRRRTYRLLSVAAVVLLLVLATFLLGTGEHAAGQLLRAQDVVVIDGAGTRRPAEPGETFLVGETIATGDAPASFHLANGFNLRLDARSRAEILEAGVIRLEAGTLYADSQGAEGGLRVQTALGEVQDVGTQFAVALLPGTLQVQVREGLVKVNDAVKVSRGERLRIARDGQSTREAVAPADDSWRWTESVAPPIAVEAVSLDDFLAAVQSQTGLQVQYASDDLARRAAQMILHGHPADLPPRQLLDVVLSASGFQYEIRNSTVLIRDR